MASIDSYDLDTTINPLDKVIGTDGAVGETNGDTKNFTVSALSSYIIEQSQSSTITPNIITAEPGSSSTYSSTNNVIYLQWSGASGTYDLTLPSASANQYRVIQIISGSSLNASDKVHVYGPVDGQAFYNLNKAYSGVKIWSDGVEWIVIQAKSP